MLDQTAHLPPPLTPTRCEAEIRRLTSLGLFLLLKWEVTRLAISKIPLALVFSGLSVIDF